ncbi:HNH endonuclease [Pseudonocardia phyllosphaerae]|uniref:HNH endonuclease n=1 Tax=Pseudonocardia phyllosphaerae TaxID=3390502 RepID=UPI00397B2CE2
MVDTTVEEALAGHMLPGGTLAALCEATAAAPGELSDRELLKTVEAAVQLERWAGAVRTRLLGALVERHPPGSTAPVPDATGKTAVPVARWLPSQVAIATRLTEDQARGELGMAERLYRVLPETLAEWEAGRIGERAAEAIAESTQVLDDDAARAVQAAILPGASTITQTRLRARLRTAIHRADPEGASKRHQRAFDDREVSISRSDNGMGSLWLSGSAAQTEASWNSLDRLARSLGTEDPRTLAQRRCDLAHELLQGTVTITDLTSVMSAVSTVVNSRPGVGTTTSTGSGVAPAPRLAGAAGASNGIPGSDTGFGTAQTTEATTGTETTAATGAAIDEPTGVDAEVIATAVAEVLAHKPDPNATIGRKPLIQVVVGLDTLLGGSRPGEITGHGPISAATARALAAGGDWKRLVTDPVTGQLLDYGRNTYRPPANLHDHVHGRDGTCRGPDCERRIRDLDHHLDWGKDGHTVDDNLFGLCQRHHKLKDVTGWHALVRPDGGLTWISPDGYQSTTYPKDYRVFTEDTVVTEGVAERRVLDPDREASSRRTRITRLTGEPEAAIPEPRDGEDDTPAPF